LADPLLHLPERRPGSVRRTSHLDVITLPDGSLDITGEAHETRDVRGDVATCRAEVGSNRKLVALEMGGVGAVSGVGGVGGVDKVDGIDGLGSGDSGMEDLSGLLGRVVGRGFRAAVDEISPPGSLRWSLLTDLPLLALLSGYGTLYSGQLNSPITSQFIEGLPVDICAGWAKPGFMMVHIRDHHEVPTPDGPEVPLDTGGWHETPMLVAGVLRRQRLIERTGDEIWAMFRDSYARADASVSVLHEYTVSATVERIKTVDHVEEERIESCVAIPRVLPWAECPQAAASAGRLVGQRVVDVGRQVREDFAGTSTSTHLNDLLSSLAQADALRLD
jgi:hypothetical protein